MPKIEDGLTNQQRYYNKKKNDPEFQEKNRKARKDYYERNKEMEREQSLNRYYAKKATNMQGSPSPS